MKKKPDWPWLLEAFEGSGLTHAQFCSKHNISLTTFHQRLYRSRKESRAAEGFSQLAVAAPSPEAPWAELHFQGGFSLRFPAAVDSAYLAELLTLLRR